MLEAYTDFMIFEVEDNGERSRLNITEEVFHQNNGAGILHSSQVAIIVKEELRRIYIWKGISSSVRKKFIASHVASEIQRELMNSSSFHRCKIVSIDQTDEPNEFLNTFGFQKKSNPAEIYDDQNTLEAKKINGPNEAKQVKSEDFQKIAVNNKLTPSYEGLKNAHQSKKILDRILNKKVPDNFKRKHVLIGKSNLYGISVKKAEIFNEVHEMKDWEMISNLPRETIDLEGHKLRIHFNKDLGEIEAIEILEKTESEKNDKEITGNDYRLWTVKQLKQFCSENNIKVSKSYRKADIIRLVVEYTELSQNNI
ncbi:MAG: hypothetical protein KGD65_12930 [Candidatus Lokiarchaeota archaeon]|nr:hypothetical protein [Candidatus Lokiarchaeota archaeon]